MIFQCYPHIRLNLFDGEGADGGTQGDTTASSDPTLQSNPGDSTTPPSDAGREPTPEARRKAFREMVSGEFRDIYTEETQRIINKRFKEAQQTEQQLRRAQPLLQRLMERYAIADGDLDKLSAAMDREDALRSRRAHTAARQQLTRWYEDARQVKGQYPDFDLRSEVRRPDFLSMLRSGVSMQQAYEVLHMEEIKAGISALEAHSAEKRVADAIRAKGARPRENGTTGQSGFTVRDDPAKWSKADRAEVIRRAAKGETITL